MDLHKKFAFDDPEDSYWNENESQSFFFEDAQNADLYEVDFDLPADDESNCDSERQTELPPAEPNRSAKVFAGGESSRPLAATSSAPRLTETPLRSRRTLGSSSIISDCSLNSFSSDVTIHLDFARLKAEHKKLQQYLDRVRQERFEPPPISLTIKRLRACERVALDFYKSKAEKLQLLDEALETLNNDVVLVVLLFLKRTLIASIFREVLIFKPEAATTYLAYLRECNAQEELVDTLFEEAAMVEFGLAHRKCQYGQKVNALKKSLVSGFSDPTLAAEARFVQEYIHLLERQIPIDAADEEEASRKSNELFEKFPKKARLVGQPLFTTLYYCCLYHYGLPANAYASPLAFKQAFNVNDKAFFWMAASSLCRRKEFAQVEKLLTAKKMLVSQKLVCPVPWPAFFQLVAKYGPPGETLCKWLRAIPDSQERLKVAEQFGPLSADVQIEVIAGLKDRQKLVQLIGKLNPRSVEYNKAQLILANAAAKWNN